MATETYYSKTRSDPHHKAYRLWNNARQRARQYGYEFDLPIEWVKEVMAEGRCQVTGIPFSKEIGEGKGRMNPFAPSLDKINPDKGYTPDNTVMVIWMYNAAKHVSSHEDVMRMARALIIPESE